MDVSNKIKIAYFLDIPHGLGGAGNLLLQQAVLMSELYEVLAVIPSDSQGNINEEYANRCEQHGLPYCSLKYSTAYNFCNIDFLGAMDSTEIIEELIKREKITLLHSVQLNVAVEYVARKLKITHVMDIYQLREEEFKCCPGDIYPHYHLCDSRMYMERWSRQLGIESRCVRPVALLNKMRKKDVYPQKEIHILMLGSVCERKNQLTAIKACELCMNEYDLTLTIAGDNSGNYSKKCIQYVKEHGFEEKIIFKGFVSDIVPLLEESDCLLCTSTDESFPSSMVEALTYDLTIISTPVAGVPEIFENGYNAFISMDNTVNSIRNALVKCIQSYKSGDIREIHWNAEKTWDNNFARSIVREQIDSYYKEVIMHPYIEKGDFLYIMPEVKQTVRMLSDVYDDCEGMQQRALYHTILRKELKSGKMYLWGAGKMGGYAYKILSVICPDLEIMAFIDKRKEGNYYGLPILKVEELPIDKTLLYGIGFCDGRENAIAYLEKMGLELNKQIWMVP